MSRHRILWVISLLVSTIFSLPNLSLSAQERRTALVIGNGNYKSSPLRNPVNDANDIAKALRSLGFTVIHKKNASQREMEKSIRDFGERLRKGGVGLFYYAGHGVQVNGRNYLIPLGAEIYEETDVKYEAVDAGRVLDAMYNAGNAFNIVILDACRDNPFARSFRSSTTGLARMDAPTGTLIAYSTSPGKVAIDGKGRNSPYTIALLKYMDDPGLTIEQVFKKCRRHIAKATGKKQIPWESTSLTGDFYFIPERGIAVTKRPTVEADNRLTEERESLERERRELERLKTEIERKRLEVERKQLEAEKKRLEMASLPKMPGAREIARDGQYIAYANGIVRDTNTGLEWKVGPNRNMDWYDAKSWVEGLNIDGGGWRMPTIDELKGLYQSRKGSRNMTPLLKTTGWWVWSGETKGSLRARSFGFNDGGMYWDDCLDPYGSSRAFAVRSRSDG